MGSKPHYHGAGRWGETDWDAEYNARRLPVLPQHARCETCFVWARSLNGACGFTLFPGPVRLKYAEDRCDDWIEHPEWGPTVNTAAAQWTKERMQKYWRTRKELAV